VAPVRAASLSGSGSSGDGGASAWQVLGVAEGADSEQVRQAYNRKKLGASEAEIEKYEAAYNTLLMQQLTMRMQGKAGSGESLASDVRFADRMVLPAPLAKRIPRLDRALTKRFFLINTVCYCLFTLMMLQDARGQEPLMLATGTFFFRLFLKLMGDQSKGSGEPMEEKKKRERQNFGRAFLFIFGALAIGIIGSTFVPVQLGRTFGIILPLWVYSQQRVVVNVVSTSLMYVVGTFFR